MIKSDRFIPSTIKKKHLQINLNSQRQPPSKNENTPKIANLYQTFIINSPLTPTKNNQNIFSYSSSKTIQNSIITPFNQNPNQQNKFQYLNTMGIDITKFQLGPAIVSKPDRILQALSLSDNFYVDLLDCSSQSMLAVGLSKGVYIWQQPGKISRIRQIDDITCIKWNLVSPNIIAYGSKQGFMDIWDINKNKCINLYEFHKGRVGSLAWFNNNNCLLSGGFDSNIFSYDLRSKNKIGKYKYHSQQICAIKIQNSQYNNNGNNNTQVFASGSNDKKLVIWNTRMRIPQIIYNNNSAIKGIAWHPNKSNILATGGGIQDKTIKIRNICTNQLIKNIDTGSQVCNLMYIQDGQKLISTHGYNNYEINIWDSYNMIKTKTFLSHKKRVLYLTAQPYGQIIITGAGDQTIRFWKVNDKEKVQRYGQVQETIMAIR